MFREEGITIVYIITALGMTIGVIVEGILSATKPVVKPTPGPKPKPDPKPPKPKPDPKPPKPEPGWLKNISNLLLKIADEMLIDLPGIIGSVVSFVLKTSRVFFLAEHVWIAVAAVAGILYICSVQNSTKIRIIRDRKVTLTRVKGNLLSSCVRSVFGLVVFEHLSFE